MIIHFGLLRLRFFSFLGIKCNVFGPYKVSGRTGVGLVFKKLFYIYVIGSLSFGYGWYEGVDLGVGVAVLERGRGVAAFVSREGLVDTARIERIDTIYDQ